MGLETEYAIRFTPSKYFKKRRPDHTVVFFAMKEAISRIVKTCEGEGLIAAQKKSFFVQNGGAFCYEHLPYAIEDGLLEGQTPECCTPLQLIRYQQAQDFLIAKAIPIADEILEYQGFHGTLAFLKNCKDAKQNIYGAQENYEAQVASGWQLFLYRLTSLAMLLIFIPIFLFLIMISMVFVIGSVVLVPLFVMLKPRSMSMMDLFGAIGTVIEVTLTFPVYCPLFFFHRLFAFRSLRKQMTAFMVSRIIFTGAGTLNPLFELSEKAGAIRRLTRFSILPGDRPIFDTSNIYKYFMDTFSGGAIKSLVSSKQRFQISFSDSNMAPIAEYLKVGVTSLIIEMIEQNFIQDAPQLRNPIVALRIINGDDSLLTSVDTKCGKMTALEIQRFYLEKAKQYSQETTNIEVRELVNLWEKVLNDLESSRQKLIGKIDWITKKFLLEQVADEEFSVRKKMDLRYHELNSGYFAQLQDKIDNLRLFDEQQIDEAIFSPPGNTPAFFRGNLISGSHDLDLRVGWKHAKGKDGRVVSFYRKK
ncbi:hypothetical protein UABAM_03104 [Candidatus Uabimicrobium amorphum]|uniref:Uncharacterized protein n=2 Tax=Uabimicrobium amorphum TaxID=2596890 RepID=A0A5S9IMQ1_UABAM|nr:hypothetical protein UABAM_03104 [Candidatus Uabimicrobium amorphum]